MSAPPPHSSRKPSEIGHSYSSAHRQAYLRGRQPLQFQRLMRYLCMYGSWRMLRRLRSCQGRSRVWACTGLAELAPVPVPVHCVTARTSRGRVSSLTVGVSVHPLFYYANLFNCLIPSRHVAAVQLSPCYVTVNLNVVGGNPL